MAAANMKSVKLRIKSIQNTMQITKAMELVASSKLRKAKEKAENTKPYFHTLKKTLYQGKQLRKVVLCADCGRPRYGGRL